MCVTEFATRLDQTLREEKIDFRATNRIKGRHRRSANSQALGGPARCFMSWVPSSELSGNPVPLGKYFGRDNSTKWSQGASKNWRKESKVVCGREKRSANLGITRHPRPGSWPESRRYSTEFTKAVTMPCGSLTPQDGTGGAWRHG